MAKKTELRALLVGVTEYARPPKNNLTDPASFAVNLPSAALDVAEMLELTDELARLYPGGAEVLPLVEPWETTKGSILLGLRWLFEEAGADWLQLLFYFSGHGALRVDASGQFLDQVLLPSDYDWLPHSNQVLTDAEMMVPAQRALNAGACLEVVLETCSATRELPKQGPAQVRAFGCFFGSTRFPAGSGAVWAACKTDESSHSGPVPSPCPEPRRVLPVIEQDKQVQGLFTYFFCGSFFASRATSRSTPRPRTRRELLDKVTLALGRYRSAYEQCCEREMGKQTPTLYTAQGLATAATSQAKNLGRPLRGDCDAIGPSKQPFAKAPEPCPPPELGHV